MRQPDKALRRIYAKASRELKASGVFKNFKTTDAIVTVMSKVMHEAYNAGARGRMS